MTGPTDVSDQPDGIEEDSRDLPEVPRAVEFHLRVRMDVEEALNEGLGTEEEDGAGGGLAADVWLLVDKCKATEASRRDWAVEAMRLHLEKDEAEAPASWDYPHPWRDNGGGDPYYHSKGDCRSCGRPYDDELHDEPFGPPPILAGPNAPCACISDEQAAALAPPFTRPVCAVHRIEGGSA